MSTGERVIIEVGGRRVKALRVWLRASSGKTPGGQATIPPREYREVPANLTVAIGDMLKDEEEDAEMAITYIRRPRKVSGLARSLVLRCE